MQIIITDDGEKYNRVIKSHPKSHILQTYEWGQLKSDYWKPYYLLFKEDQDFIGGMLILERKVPGINRNILYSPRGPVIDLQNYELLSQLIQQLKKFIKAHKAVYLRLDPDISVKDETVHQNLKKLGFYIKPKNLNFESIQPKFVFRLNIKDKTTEELLNSFHSKTRYNIRLAKRRGVQIREGGREDISSFYNLMKTTGERDDFVIRPIEYFESMYDLFVPKGFMKLFMASYGGEDIAGTICLKFGNKCWYLYGASANKHRNKMPNYLLQWEMIKWAHSEDCEIYDFRGVSGDLDPSNPLYGLYRFKKGFNGDFTEFLGEYDLISNNALYKMIDAGLKVRKKIMHLKK